MVGPIIGQLLFSAVGFEYTFYYTAVIIAIPFLLVLFVVPNRINLSAAERENLKNQDVKNIDEEPDKQITFKMFLTNKRAMMASVSSIIAMVIMLFMDTIYSNYLLSVGVGEDYIGYFFALACFVYSVCSPLVGYLCKWIPKIFMT